jgi:hypothetical protein
MRRVFSAATLACVSLLAVPALAADTLQESFNEQETQLCEACDCEQECYDCCDYFNGRQRFLGLLPSDHCFDRFVSPLSNPFFFEDPRSLTEVRGVFIDNSLPNTVSGGDFQLYAAQIRGRVTDRVSIIAPRIGVFNVNQAGGDTPNGLLSAPVGFKFNFIRDAERQFLVSGGLTYFIKGSTSALSNFGDGDYHLYLTAGKQIFDRGHWLSGTGFRLPGDNNWGTQLWYWSNQWDYEVVDGFYGLVGLNWFHWMSSSGLNMGAPVTGLDILNLPNNNVAGTNVVSAMTGVKWKPSAHCEVGTGFEFALSDNRDILRNRLYIDFIVRY